MITNEDEARRTNSFKRLSTKKESYDKTMKYIGAKDKEGENVDFYFDNFEPGDTRWVSAFWNLLPIMFDLALYFGALAYLFTLETALVGLFMPIAGMTVMFVFLMVVHIAGFRLKKAKKRL